MKLIEEPYIGQSVKDIGTIVYAIHHNISLLNTFFICISQKSKFQVEILDSRQYLQTRNKQKDFIIAGIAATRKEAYDLVLFIVQEMADKNNLSKETLKEYLLHQYQDS